MTRLVAQLAGLGLALAAQPARALDRLETDASLGFAFPAGSLERGSRVGDTTSGAIPIALSAPVRLGDRFAIGPSLSVRAGAFTSASKSTPAWSDSSLDGGAIHAWLRAALDARVSF